MDHPNDSIVLTLWRLSKREVDWTALFKQKNNSNDKNMKIILHEVDHALDLLYKMRYPPGHWCH